jgi:hypothetical protein
VDANKILLLCDQLSIGHHLSVNHSSSIRSPSSLCALITCSYGLNCFIFQLFEHTEGAQNSYDSSKKLTQRVFCVRVAAPLNNSASRASAKICRARRIFTEKDLSDVRKSQTLLTCVSKESAPNCSHNALRQLFTEIRPIIRDVTRNPKPIGIRHFSTSEIRRISCLNHTSDSDFYKKKYFANFTR